MGLRSCHLCGRCRLFPVLFLFLFLVRVLYRGSDPGPGPGLGLGRDRARANVFLLARPMVEKARRGIVDSPL